MPKKKKNWGKRILSGLITAFGGAFLSTLVGFLFQIGNNTFGRWYPALQFAGIGVFVALAAKLRPGKEDILETFVRVMMITSFFIMLDQLPFSIPYFSFIVTKDIISFFLVGGIVWTVDAIFMRAIPKLYK